MVLFGGINMNKKTLYCISDIHGHYYQAIEALQEAGWDENNPNHLLIVCGDIFDRGPDSVSVFEWLYKLTQEGKAIVTKGNHDDFILDFMGVNRLYDYGYKHYKSGWNGVNTTIDDFLHSTNDFGMYVCMHQDPNSVTGLVEGKMFYQLWNTWRINSIVQIKKEYPNLIDWLKSLPNYYETKNYIFTHGSIDPLCKDWHNPFAENPDYKDMTLEERWRKCHWDDGTFIIKKHLNTNKTVVVGHFSTAHLREMWQIDSKDGNDHSILKFNNNIFIDGCTILTKRVNVLIIDDEEILDNLENKKEVKKDE